MDLLTREEFEAGFGSHTPIYSGQTKCVRYYMNFERGFALLKSILAEVKEAPSTSSSIPFTLLHEAAAHPVANAEWRRTYLTICCACRVNFQDIRVVEHGSHVRQPRICIQNKAAQ